MHLKILFRERDNERGVGGSRIDLQELGQRSKRSKKWCLGPIFVLGLGFDVIRTQYFLGTLWCVSASGTIRVTIKGVDTMYISDKLHSQPYKADMLGTSDYVRKRQIFSKERDVFPRNPAIEERGQE
jgi:hypothetical protein